jgi:hypothetical protein
VGSLAGACSIFGSGSTTEFFFKDSFETGANSSVSRILSMFSEGEGEELLCNRDIESEK